VQKAHKADAGVIALVYMSHPEAAEGYGLKVSGKKQMYKIFLDRATYAGADGVVVGATQLDILKKVSKKKKMPIYSPGIGAQGGDLEKAIKSGADYLIIGRSIVESRQPAKVARDIQSRISLAVGK
jgi:orotidine-5'-phosphate decarboxylase